MCLRARSVADVILICVIWGSGFSAMKAGLDHVPPFMFVGLRFVFTALVLWPLMRRNDVPFRVPREHRGAVAALVALFFMQQGLIFWGMNYTLASRTAVVLNTQPIMTAVFAHFLVAGDRLTFGKVFGLCLALAGVQALFRGQASAAAASTLVGDWMILAAAFAWACQNILTKKLVRFIRPMTIVFWQAACGAVMFMAVSVCAERGRPMAVMNPTFLFCLAYIVLVATAYSFVRWVHLIRDNDPSTVTSFCFVTPVAGVMFGRVLLHEPVTWDIVMATVAVAVGIVCANVRWRKPPPPMPEPPSEF